MGFLPTKMTAAPGCSSTWESDCSGSSSTLSRARLALRARSWGLSLLRPTFSEKTIFSCSLTSYEVAGGPGRADEDAAAELEGGADGAWASARAETSAAAKATKRYSDHQVRRAARTSPA